MADNTELRQAWEKQKRGYKKTHVPQCKRCGFFAPWESKQWMEIHHIKPLIDGGDNSESNLVVLCHFCHYEWHHFAEGNIDFQEFINQLPLHVIGAAMGAHDKFGKLGVSLDELKNSWWQAKEKIMVVQPYKDETCTEYTRKHCAEWVDW